MGRPRIVLTNRVFPETIEFLSTDGEVVANQGDEPLAREELLRRARDAQALMVFMPDAVDGAFLDACPALRVIACALKGADNFDLAACRRRGVWLTVVPDLLTEPTAELAVGLAIALGRHVLAADRTVRAGAFHGGRAWFYGTSLDGSTVAPLGAGKVGRAIARKLSGFACSILMVDVRADTEPPPNARLVTLDEAVAAADFVILAMPLDACTLHLVNRDLLQRFKEGALLINPARGSLVDEVAVAEALAAGRLGGYSADVFEFEDWLRKDRPPVIEPRLLRAVDRTVFTAPSHEPVKSRDAVVIVRESAPTRVPPILLPEVTTPTHEAVAALPRCLSKGDVSEIDRDHQHLSDRPTIRSAGIGATLLGRRIPLASM
jgi:phosphonate dehydrogenase